MTSLAKRTVGQADGTLGLAARVASGRPRDLQRVVLFMLDGSEISGLLHCTPGTRTLDFLNHQAESFVAMTGATIKRAERTDSAAFIAINKVHILRVVEDATG